MKDTYTAPSVSIYSLASCSDLANNFSLNQLLGRPTSGQYDGISSEGSGPEYPFRD